MRVMHKRVAGLDVHKKTVVATRMQVTEEERLEWETQTFETNTPDLLRLHDWLGEWACSHVAMESTGDYWKPVYNVLEGTYQAMVVNARHVAKVPGRKTDVKDSEWLAELLMYGLLRASFVPPKAQRALRELTRYRSKLIAERSRTVNRVQKVLEGANIKLGAVVSDIQGVSAQAMLRAIVAGNTNAAEMAQLARGRLRHKIEALEKALTGYVQDHHRFVLAMQLGHIDFLDEQIHAISAEIASRMEALSSPPAAPPRAPDPGTGEGESEDSGPSGLSWEEAVTLLSTSPGIDRRSSESILTEIGLDMHQFPTAKDLTAWSGLAPGNYTSGGKRYSGRTRQGNQTLKSTLIQVAWAAVRTQGTFLKARYHRLAARRGKKRAIVAVARSILVSIWHMLSRGVPYVELSESYYDQRRKESKITRLTRELEKLTGGQVQIELSPMPS